MEGFQHYVPEKELPEEIQNLPREETKCRSCGVSYLVHHEVAKLEKEVGKLREPAGHQDGEGEGGSSTSSYSSKGEEATTGERG